MASTSSTTLSIASSSSFADAKPHHSPLPSTVSLTRKPSKPTSYCLSRKIARNVVAMATGDAPSSTTTEIDSTDFPDVLKPVQQAWDKIEDKYAVSSLAVASVVALWGSTGVISAIDRLPVLPGVLELVGIGYTGWFAYRNLIFKPDREALVTKIKVTYNDITGSS